MIEVPDGVGGYQVTMILCDHAQVAEGKLFISGGGWDVMGPGAPGAVAILIHVPWTNTNQQITFELKLERQDGEAVVLPGPAGSAPVVVGGVFEVGRPVGAVRGQSIIAPMAINYPPLALASGEVFCWALDVDGQRAGHITFRTPPGAPGVAQPE